MRRDGGGDGPPAPLLLRLPRPLPRRVEFHVLGSARRRFDIHDSLVAASGEILTADLGALQRLAAAMAAAAPAGEPAPSTGQLLAAAVMHELMHVAIAESERAGRISSGRVLASLAARHGMGPLAEVLNGFRRLFPATIGAPGRDPGEGVGPDTGRTLDDDATVLQEIVLLTLHNSNPALAALTPLLDDTALRQETPLAEITGSLGAGSLAESRAEGGASVPEAATSPVAGAEGDAALAAMARLVADLAAPQLANPHDLRGQLEHMRTHWAFLLEGDAAAASSRLLAALDTLAEESVPRGGPGPGPAAPPEPVGLVGLDSDVRLSSDADWMENVVMVARNCFVWLGQLSKRHGRDILRLDDIPESELAQLAAAGINALWLIGIWRRSEASRRIKRLRGQPFAEASAYALYDYEIADDLGGDAALAALRERAAAHGIRLVSDMVPNHTGMDGRWVREHPEWFVRLPHPPFPSYGFTGEDLSDDPALGIFLEDHYYDGSDAAVVFRRADNTTGEQHFIYHGNDGTGMPWNDTAQIDYLNPEAREAVIRTIVGVARKFPIIRFDAAMTLVRRHVQRLWYPPPGEGGAIPSRSWYGVTTQEEFDLRMPREFWREVVDRVAAEAPDTLLIAEAFWMLEGYFVRNLGMHRVYNSAFMHMLRDGDNAGFRDLLREVLSEDPRLLGRFVNYMNNPDEDSAAEQFGSDSKYFCVCVLMATLPGLPLFGHGQIEGLHEKYGMEFRSARLDEQPDPGMVARHEREIFPLLRRRHLFAGSSRFELCRFEAESGDGNGLIAYSNAHAAGASLVACNNAREPVTGRIRAAEPRPRAAGGNDELSLVAALDLTGADGDFVVWRALPQNLEYLLPLAELRESGLRLDLPAHGYQVFVDFRVLAVAPGLPLARLHGLLGQAGVPDVVAAARDLPWRAVRRRVRRLVEAPGEEHAGFVLPEGFGPVGAADRRAALGRLRALETLATEDPGIIRELWAALGPAARLCLRLGAPLPADAVAADSHAVDADAADVAAADAAAALIAATPVDDPDPARVSGTAAPVLAGALPRLLAGAGPVAGAVAELVRTGPTESWWLSSAVAAALDVHDYEGTAWFRAEPWNELAAAWALAFGLEQGSAEAAAAEWARLSAARAVSGYRFERLLAALEPD